MQKKGLKLTLVILAVLFVISASVAVAVFATESARQAAASVKLDMIATNLSFSDSVYIKYAVSFENVDADDVSLLIWTAPQSEYVQGTQSAELTNVGTETIDGVECVIFNYTGLAAKQMTDNVYARAYAKVNGVDCYSETKKYSVLQYAYNKMGKTGTATDNPELIALLEDMLGYGALAQKYTNYKTDTLATDNFVQIKLTGGVHTDGFDHGLYKAGTNVTIPTPAVDGLTFVGWRSSDGSTYNGNTIEAGDKNEVYFAVYRAGNDLEYTANADGKTYSLTGGGASAGSNPVILSDVGGKLVTGIADGVFKDCDNIRSVTICKNIKTIGAEAFSGCSNLTTINYEGSKSQWNSITKGENWDNGVEYTVNCQDTGNDWELPGVPLG